MITLAAISTQVEAEVAAGHKHLRRFNSGRFEGQVSLTWLGPRSYYYAPNGLLPFSFHRHDGLVITPGSMMTDAGTIPRLAWSIIDLDPLHFLPAYIIHDWCFEAHRRKADILDFAETSIVLGEAIQTLIETGISSAGHPWIIEIIYRAVSSSWGRALWDLPKEEGQ